MLKAAHTITYMVGRVAASTNVMAGSITTISPASRTHPGVEQPGTRPKTASPYLGEFHACAPQGELSKVWWQICTDEQNIINNKCMSSVGIEPVAV